MPSWKKVVASGSDASFSSLTVDTYVSASSFNGSFTGSLQGTASQAISSSYALTASYALISTEPIIVTSPGGIYYINGVAKPVLTFVPGQNYRFDTTAVDGHHPFKFSLTANGPTQYTYGVTSGSGFIEINVDYATSSSLFYYCTIHSGMGNQANTLRDENLIHNSQTSSMSVLSSSYAYTASSATNAAQAISASYAYTASSATNSEQAISASYAYTASSAINSLSASYAYTASSAISAYTASSAINATTALTASSADTFLVRNDITASSALIIGTITAQTLVVQTVTSSVVYSSGSNTFGNALTDRQTFTGSVNITGSLSVNGSEAILTNQTASMSVASAVSASYALNGGVTQILAGANVTIAPTSGKGQVTISATGGGGSNFNTATGSYGSFYDTTTQTNPVANTPRSMSFNTTDITNGVSISGSTSPFNTYIKTENPGVYNIQFSAQLDKTDSGTDEILIWLRKNGSDLTDTATTITLTNNNTKEVAAWNWFVNSAANDYYQIIWLSADTDMRLFAESISGTHPGIPSVIATVNRVDQFLSNSGSFSGSFSGALTGSLFGTSSWAQNASTASYVVTAQTASYVANAVSSSYAYTASSAVSSSYAYTASSAINASASLTSVSASYALTASYALNGGGGGLSALFIADEGTTQGTASYINFTGAGVTATVSAGTASINITGGGSSGTSGLSTTFTQSVAAETWSFVHNLNTRYPLIQVYDTTYNQVTPQYVSSSTADTVIIGFGVPVAGYAVASNGGTLYVTGSNVILDQAVAATTWSFNHNLNTQYPIFQVFDSTNEVVVPQRIVATDATSSLIYFPSPVAGKAVASVGGISGSMGSGVGFPFSGSAVITGSFLVSQSFVDFSNTTGVTGSFSGSLYGTASYATFALSCSFAPGFTTNFTQSIAATTWSFTHNLNTITPIVQVYDLTNAQIIPNQIVGMNNSTVEVRFDYAQAGYAVASNGGGLYVTGSTSTLVQTAANVTWSFTHNLNNKYNTYEVYDDSDVVIIPSGIKALTNNTAEIYFSGPQTGRAVAQFSGINGSPNAATASFANTASFVSNLVQNVFITGSLTVTGSAAFTGSFSQNNGFVTLTQVSQSLNFANDAAAAVGGVPLGGLYRSGNFILIRLS